MNSVSRAAASTLVAAGLLAAGVTAASAAPAAPAERISGSAQLQAHLAKAVAAEAAHAGVTNNIRTNGWAAAVASLDVVTDASC